MAPAVSPRCRAAGLISHNKLMTAKRRCQLGFSLLEVLITLIVLGMGLISLAKFQGTVLKDNDLAKARVIAVQLAEEKLEDLRRYQELVTIDPTTLAVVTSCAGGTIRYACIDTNQGGVIGSGNITVSAIDFNRTWTVNNYCYNSTLPNTLASTTNPCKYSYPNYKLVTVTVTWTDQDNILRNVALRTIISAVDPAKSGRVLEN